MRILNFCLMIFLLVGLTFVPTNHNIQAQEALPSPYLFYYSELYHTFLLESPDGIESYRLFDGIMPENQIRIRSVGWAPSNEWFAWLSHDSEPETMGSWQSYPGYLWVVDAQGQGSMFPTEDYVVDAQWSPIQDVLAITTQVRDPDVDSHHVYLWDVISQAVVGEFETENTGALNIEWSPVETQLLVYSYDWGSSQIDDMIVLNLDGSPLEFNVGDTPLEHVQWLPDGQLLTLAKDSHTLRIIALQDRTNEASAGGDYSGQWISPLGTYWLLANGDGTGFYIYTIPDFEPLIVTTDKAIRDLVAWSPDNEYALFELDSENDRIELGLLSLAEQTLTVLELNEADSPAYLGFVVRWLADNQGILIGTAHNVYQYTMADQTFNPIAETMDGTIGLSLDETLLLTYANCTSIVENEDWSQADYPTCLNNLLTGEVARIAPHSGLGLPIGPMGTNWSSDNEWFILTEFINVGGEFPPYYSVVNRWGDYHRELTQDTWAIEWIEDPARFDFLISQSFPFDVPPPHWNINAHETDTHTVAWHPLGPLVVSGAFNGEVTIFSAGQPVLTIQDGLTTWENLGRIRALAWLENEYIVGISENGQGGYIVKIWDGSNTVEPFLDEFPVEAEWDAIEGEVYLTLSGDRYGNSYIPTVKVDLINRQAAIKSPENSNIYIIYTRDYMARIVAAESTPATLYLENHDGEVLREVSLAHTETQTGWSFPYINFALSSDGRYLAGTGDTAGGLLVWDTSSGEDVARYYISGRNLAFSPDNEQIAVASSTNIVIWDLPSLPQ